MKTMAKQKFAKTIFLKWEDAGDGSERYPVVTTTASKHAQIDAIVEVAQYDLIRTFKVSAVIEIK